MMMMRLIAVCSRRACGSDVTIVGPLAMNRVNSLTPCDSSPCERSVITGGLMVSAQKASTSSRSDLLLTMQTPVVIVVRGSRRIGFSLRRSDMLVMMTKYPVMLLLLFMVLGIVTVFTAVEQAAEDAMFLLLTVVRTVVVVVLTQLRLLIFMFRGFLGLVLGEFVRAGYTGYAGSSYNGSPLGGRVMFAISLRLVVCRPCWTGANGPVAVVPVELDPTLLPV